MSTISKIQAHAAELIHRGAPFTKDELAVLKMATPSGKAGNAGKRKIQKTGHQ